MKNLVGSSSHLICLYNQASCFAPLFFSFTLFIPCQQRKRVFGLTSSNSQLQLEMLANCINLRSHEKEKGLFLQLGTQAHLHTQYSLLLSHVFLHVYPQVQKGCVACKLAKQYFIEFIFFFYGPSETASYNRALLPCKN